jgi:hypothetical protein
VALKATNKNEGAYGTISQLLLYKKFSSLSFDDNQAAFDERKRLNITPKRSRRGDGVESRQESRG